ncbi:MAG: hypothetical protein HA495_00860 [Thaumarchaeota archaeon]|jgi:DNA polymerase III sliding clamp (beta) subunit (PCNA family)|nr:hypothetical protein [Nitrososphaerota archaeon]
MSSEEFESKVVLKDSEILRDALKVVSSISDEAPIKVSKDSVILRTLDLSEVSMIDIVIPSQSFEEYEVKNENAYVIKVEDALKLLKHATKNPIALTFQQNKLLAEIRSSPPRKFSLSVFQSEKKDLPLPKVSYKISFKTELDIIKEVVEVGKGRSDRIEFETKNGKVKISTKSEDMVYEVELSPEDGTLKEPNIEEEGSAKYDIGRIYQFISSFKPLSDVSINFGKDLPLKITGEIWEGIPLNYFLAALVEE